MAQINLGHVVGPGVPSGGTAGQVLKKNSSTNYDASWVDPDALPEVNAPVLDLAAAYNASTVYQEGDRCTKDGNFYKRKSWGADTPAAEAWTAAHWDQITVSSELDAEATARAAADTSTNQAIANVQNGLAYIVGNTNTTGSTLTVGQFVYVKGHSTIAEGLREVTASISANGNITTSNTSACSDGGLNALNSKIANLKKNAINSTAIVLSYNTEYTAEADGYVRTMGNSDSVNVTVNGLYIIYAATGTTSTVYVRKGMKIKRVDNNATATAIFFKIE